MLISFIPTLKIQFYPYCSETVLQKGRHPLSKQQQPHRKLLQATKSEASTSRTFYFTPKPMVARECQPSHFQHKYHCPLGSAPHRLILYSLTEEIVCYSALLHSSRAPSLLAGIWKAIVFPRCRTSLFRGLAKREDTFMSVNRVVSYNNATTSRRAVSPTGFSWAFRRSENKGKLLCCTPVRVKAQYANGRDTLISAFNFPEATYRAWLFLKMSCSKKTWVTFVQKKVTHIHISQHKSRFCSSLVLQPQLSRAKWNQSNKSAH